MKKTLIHNACIPGMPDGITRVLFDEDSILNVGGDELADADEYIDAHGMLLLPGVIDAHVHFREPGLTHKADIESESKAALAGGVTSFFDMPNTVPPTTTFAAWQQKMVIASNTSLANYAFFIGATNNNREELSKIDFSQIPGIKVFLGSSTGNLLVDDKEMLDFLFTNFKAPIVVHAEDESTINYNKQAALKHYSGNVPVFEHSNIRSVEACVKATAGALELLSKHTDAHLHVAHISTSDEVELIRQAKKDGLNVTCEVSPHHLLFTVDDYERLGTRIKMNPAIKSASHREALRRGVVEGVIDIIATDHAPHTAADKNGDALTAMSGAPMVQFSLPVILDLFGADAALRTMAQNPAAIFGVERRGFIAPGYAPEMVLVEYSDAGYVVSDNDVLSKCGWTPLAGTMLHHRVVRTFLSKPEALKFNHPSGI